MTRILIRDLAAILTFSALVLSLEARASTEIKASLIEINSVHCDNTRLTMNVQGAMKALANFNNPDDCLKQAVMVRLEIEKHGTLEFDHSGFLITTAAGVSSGELLVPSKRVDLKATKCTQNGDLILQFDGHPLKIRNYNSIDHCVKNLAMVELETVEPTLHFDLLGNLISARPGVSPGEQLYPSKRINFLKSECDPADKKLTLIFDQKPLKIRSYENIEACRADLANIVHEGSRSPNLHFDFNSNLIPNSGPTPVGGPKEKIMGSGPASSWGLPASD